MSLEAARVKEESDTMADAVVIKEEELKLDCVEVPYVAIEAAIVDVEFESSVPPVVELHSKDFNEPAVYLDVQNELLKPECVDMPLCLGADSVSQYAENIKDELVLEPECIQHVNTGLTRLPTEKFNPILTDCWVRIERCAAVEKAVKKHLAQLYVEENRKHTRMRDNEDFFCEECKRNENFEFCEACNTSIRALNQLRNLREKRYTCDICYETFEQRYLVYQHKFFDHGII